VATLFSSFIPNGKSRLRGKSGHRIGDGGVHFNRQSRNLPFEASFPGVFRLTFQGLAGWLFTGSCDCDCDCDCVMCHVR